MKEYKPVIRLDDLVAIGLIFIGILSRLAPHLPNVTPLMAIALFGGTYLAKRWAILLPLSIIAFSDIIIGLHETVMFTWGAFILTGLIACWIRQRPNASRIVAGALSGSVLFFLITNFGVWLAGNLYPLTAAGLWQCYVAAIPFFRNSLAGDLIYTAVFFGSYAMLGFPRQLATSQPE